MVMGGAGGVKIGTVFLKKLGSDLVVQKSRYHHFEVFVPDQQDGHGFMVIEVKKQK